MTIHHYSSIVLGPGEGKKTAMAAMGIEITYKAVSTETGGGYFLFDYKAPSGFAGPPAQIHNNSEEAFYVLEGELTLHLGDQKIKGVPGSFIQVPRGTVHTFATGLLGPARFLGLVIPGGLEDYFDELPKMIEQHGYPHPPTSRRPWPPNTTSGTSGRREGRRFSVAARPDIDSGSYSCGE